MEVKVMLEHSPRTDTILLGYNVGSFDNGELSGHVSASGKTVRVTVNGVDGYVDINIQSAVDKAVELLTA